MAWSIASAGVCAPPVPLVGRRPIRWSAPRADELARLAGELAAADRVAFSKHAMAERMAERGIDEDDARAILCSGSPYKLEPGIQPGEWRLNLSRKVRGRNAAVTVSLSPGCREAHVITVMWLDH